MWRAKSLCPTDIPLSWLEGRTPLGGIRTLLKILSSTLSHGGHHAQRGTPRACSVPRGKREGAAALWVTWGPQSHASRRTGSRAGTAGQGRKETKGRGTASLRGLGMGMAPQSAPGPRAGPSCSLSAQLWVKSYGVKGAGGERVGLRFCSPAGLLKLRWLSPEILSHWAVICISHKLPGAAGVRFCIPVFKGQSPAELRVL